MALSKQQRINAAKLLCKRLRYEPETGIFTWVEVPKNNPHMLGKRAGWLSCKGAKAYRHIGPERISEHVLAWFYMTGEWPELSIDHINRVKTDNRWSNLRLATPSQQCANTDQKGGNSRFRGVYLGKRKGFWQAQLKRDGGNTYLGIFTTELDAACAYDSAAIEFWGDYYTPQTTQAQRDAAQPRVIAKSSSRFRNTAK